MTSSDRLRFAPSPTGMLHIGNARAALFNWLHVRHHGGTFILRIEDTDAERNRDEWTQGILDAMTWIGLDWDEGPYFQTDNKASHVAAGRKLYEEGKAYYCDCTREAVDQRTKGNTTPGYDRFCRDRGLQPGEGRALRFRVPDGKTEVPDLIRGAPMFDNSTIEDFVVVRSNGAPMYLLANVVDDMEQEITHVVRGEEHLPNAPKQLMLWSALGESTPPIYAHLPVIVNEKRQKLSKRRDKVAVEMYRDEGFLPEAMRNYLALLGWAPRWDREVVSLEEMIAEFDLTDVIKSSAFFDIAKFTHINGEYIRGLAVDEFVSRCQPFLEDAGTTLWQKENFDGEIFGAIAPLVQERVARLDEVPSMVDFLFVDEPGLDPGAMKVMNTPISFGILEDAIARYPEIDWTVSSIHETTLRIGESHGLKLGKAQAPIRVAVTGKKVGPPLFESLVMLGRDRTMSRLQRLHRIATSTT